MFLLFWRGITIFFCLSAYKVPCSSDWAATMHIGTITTVKYLQRPRTGKNGRWGKLPSILFLWEGRLSRNIHPLCALFADGTTTWVCDLSSHMHFTRKNVLIQDSPKRHIHTPLSSLPISFHKWVKFVRPNKTRNPLFLGMFLCWMVKRGGKDQKSQQKRV